MKQNVAEQTINIPIYELGSDFYDRVQPAQFPDKILRYKNDHLNLAKISGFNWDLLWSFNSLENNIQAPLALKYHGHQFRHYNPDLGDGRGFLFAQILENHQWYDLGTKGSGTTPYSRNGDGRLTLKGAVREALATELLESYGVNTSKTACIFETGEKLIRHDEPSPTRSAVLTRYSLGHIRIGTFQRLNYFNQIENIKKLTQYVLKYYYPKESLNIDWQNEHEVSTRFFQCVSERLARLAAQIMIAGFVHGVLNSDNINVSGELFDYGPYRFLPQYSPNFTAAYFDHEGLYSFGQQPQSFLWNLMQLGSSIQKAYPDLNLQLFLENFENQFNDYLYEAFQNKLNIRFQNDETTSKAIQLFFESVANSRINYEEAFFNLHSSRIESNNLDAFSKLESTIKLKKLISEASLISESIHRHDYFKQDFPETLIISEIEDIWSQVDAQDDWSAFNAKIEKIRFFRGCYNL